MKRATSLMLSTLLIAVAGALTGMPVHADDHPTELLNAQLAPSPAPLAAG